MNINLDECSEGVISKKFPKLASDNPDAVITNMSLYYDKLNVNIFDEQLGELKKKYDVLKDPFLKEIEKLDNEYIENQSISLYLETIFKAIFSIFERKGAY